MWLVADSDSFSLRRLTDAQQLVQPFITASYFWFLPTAAVKSNFCLSASSCRGKKIDVAESLEGEAGGRKYINIDIDLTEESHPAVCYCECNVSCRKTKLTKLGSESSLVLHWTRMRMSGVLLVCPDLLHVSCRFEKRPGTMFLEKPIVEYYGSAEWTALSYTLFLSHSWTAQSSSTVSFALGNSIREETKSHFISRDQKQR